jgi:hypothetical protein
MSVVRSRRAALALWSSGMLGFMVDASPVAAGGSRVVIARDADRADAMIDRVELRLAAELRAAGFDVVESAYSGEDARKLVEQPLADEPFATVLLRRVGGGAATDVWVSDHVSHKTVVRRILAPGSGDVADRALALRVVELMRASLVEAVLLPPAEPEPAPPADVSRWTREAIPVAPQPQAAEQHVFVGIGIAALFGSAEVGLAAAPELHVAWRASGMWFVRAVAAGPAFGGRAQSAQESATVRQELALIELDREFLIGRLASASASIGAGGYHIDARIDGPTAFVPAGGDAWTVIGAAGAGVSIHLSSSASIILGGRLLAALRRPVIFLASERVATAMRPGFLGEVTLLVGL